MILSYIEIRIVQEALKHLKFYNGLIDGDYGKKTKKAVRYYQQVLRQFGFYYARYDGDYGKKTKIGTEKLQTYLGNIKNGVFSIFDAREIYDRIYKTHDIIIEENKEDKKKSNILNPKQLKYPKETRDQRYIREYFGSVGRNQTKITLPYQMRLAWNLDKKVKKITCHKKIAEDLQNIFEETLKYFGIETIRDMKLDLFSGCLNVRKMRGAKRYSLHSWGIAVDLASQYNKLHWHKPKALFSHKEYDPFWDIVERNGAYSLGKGRDFDYMHFQFAHR